MSQYINGDEKNGIERRRPHLTPKGEIIVTVALIEDDWIELLDLVDCAGSDDHEHADQLNRIRSMLNASVRLARHHATNGLTSGQAQGYIDTGLIEPPLDYDPYRFAEARSAVDEWAVQNGQVPDSDIDRRVELALDESIAEGIEYLEITEQ